MKYIYRKLSNLIGRFKCTVVSMLYLGTFEPYNQIAQFVVNIFHTHLLGGEQVNRPIKN